MRVETFAGYGRFIGKIFGAACLGGVLAAAGEYILGAVLARGGFWGSPRPVYQLMVGAEALWAAVASGLVFAVGGSVYYLATIRRGGARLTSPPLLIGIIALTGALFFRFLATFDFVRFYYKPNAVIITVFVLAVAVWFCAAGGVYLLANTIRLRWAARSHFTVSFLRGLTLGLLIPFIVAEVWAVARAREVSSSRRPDIYLVVMDAFRADRLSYYGASRYRAPTLEMYGVDAVVFKEAFTVSSWTKPAVASIFTAMYPGAHGVDASYRPLPDEAVTLASVLREGGYGTISVSANPNVTRPARMGEGFDIMDDTNQGPVFNAAGPPISCLRPFLAFVGARPLLGPLFISSNDGINLNARLKFWAHFARGRPAFFYIHYMEPHLPNLPRPEYSFEYQPYLANVGPERLALLASGPFYWHEVLKDPAFSPDYNENEVALARALYDADIRRMDVVIEDLLENIVNRPGRDAEAVIVITADHGEEFLEHGRWLHGAGLHHEVARVPLIVKAPGCKPRVAEGPVNLVDIPPTLVSFAGFDIPPGWGGLDLRPYIMSDSELPRRELLLEGVHKILMPSEEEGGDSSIDLNALVAGDYYYLRDENAGVEYFYDRRSDRWQKNNLAGGALGDGVVGVLEENRDAMSRFKGRVEEKAFGQDEITLTPRLKRQLKAFGYVR
jgi:arylsulfatase A-like enzyme